MELIDPSLPGPSPAFCNSILTTAINIFGDSSSDDFPKIHKVGDILRVHRLQVKVWNDNQSLNVQGLVFQPDFTGAIFCKFKKSSWVVLSDYGKQCRQLLTAVNTPNGTWTQDDDLRVDALRVWWKQVHLYQLKQQRHAEEDLYVSGAVSSKTLAEIKPQEESFNITGRLIAFVDEPDLRASKNSFFMWDGTDSEFPTASTARGT